MSDFDIERKELILIIQCLEYRMASINLLPVYDEMLFSYKKECSKLHMKLLKQLDNYDKTHKGELTS